MSELPSQQLYEEEIVHNISRFLHLKQARLVDLATTLGLSTDALKHKLYGCDSFHVYELEQCAQFFQVGIEMLLPNATPEIRKAEALLMTAYTLPEPVLDQVLTYTLACSEMPDPDRIVPFSPS